VTLGERALPAARRAIACIGATEEQWQSFATPLASLLLAAVKNLPASTKAMMLRPANVRAKQHTGTGIRRQGAGARSAAAKKLRHAAYVAAMRSDTRTFLP
jgi:hypothetical protein